MLSVAVRLSLGVRSRCVLYLDEWSSPCGGSVVVVDIVNPTLRVPFLLPARGKANSCGQQLRVRQR